MKSEQDNPAGLHQRYVVTKASGEPVDPRAIYFVLRLDEYGDDPEHVAACRHAALHYAKFVGDRYWNHPKKYGHLRQMALELRELVFGMFLKEAEAAEASETTENLRVLHRTNETAQGEQQ